MWSENILCTTCVFVLWSRIWFIIKNILFALKKECLFFCCWAGCSINVNLIKLVYSVVQVVYICISFPGLPKQNMTNWVSYSLRSRLGSTVLPLKALGKDSFQNSCLASDSSLALGITTPNFTQRYLCMLASMSKFPLLK